MKNSFRVSEVAIEGVQEPAVLQYFQTLNAGHYDRTAELFAPGGELHPPFDPPLVGQAAIAAYLKAEARDMVLEPRRGKVEPSQRDLLLIQVTGKVQTPLFGVRVAWQFQLNSAGEIVRVEVKLLAALEELLSFKR